MKIVKLLFSFVRKSTNVKKKKGPTIITTPKQQIEVNQYKLSIFSNKVYQKEVARIFLGNQMTFLSSSFFKIAFFKKKIYNNFTGL